MHNLAKSYLFLSLLPFAFADAVTQISDGQIQEPAEAPSVAAPKIAIAATSAPTAAPSPPTLTSTSAPAPALKPSSPPAAALKEAGAIASPSKANSTLPAPAKIQEAGTTAPILIAPAANITVPKHYVASQPSASGGIVSPAGNGTAPTAPVVPTLAPTSAEGSPREAGTTNTVATGMGGRVGLSFGVGVVGVFGLVVMLS